MKKMKCKIQFDGDVVTLLEFLKECREDFETDCCLSAEYYHRSGVYNNGGAPDAFFYWVDEND